MKKIGTTESGTLVEIGPEDIREVQCIVNAQVRIFLDGLLDRLMVAAGLEAAPVAPPDARLQSGATKPAKPEIKPAKREIAKSTKPTRGHDIYHRCEQCDAKLPADAAPQKKFCDACVKARKNNCPSMQKRKPKTVAPAKPGTREVACEKCKQTFTARLFGPVPHHCPACRKIRSAAPAAAKPEPVADGPGVSDAAKKIAALRAAKQLEKDVLASMEG